MCISLHEEGNFFSKTTNADTATMNRKTRRSVSLFWVLDWRSWLWNFDAMGMCSFLSSYHHECSSARLPCLKTFAGNPSRQELLLLKGIDCNLNFFYWGNSSKSWFTRYCGKQIKSSSIYFGFWLWYSLHISLISLHVPK